MKTPESGAINLKFRNPNLARGTKLTIAQTIQDGILLKTLVLRDGLVWGRNLDPGLQILK